MQMLTCSIVWTMEVCAWDKRAFRSLDFSFNRFFSLNYLKTLNMEILKACQEMFHCELPSVQLIERYNKFIVLMVIVVS